MKKFLIIVFLCLVLTQSAFAQNSKVLVYGNEEKPSEYACICDYCGQCNQWSGNPCCLEIEYVDKNSHYYRMLFVDPNIQEKDLGNWASCPRYVNFEPDYEKDLHSGDILKEHCAREKLREKYPWLAVDWIVNGRCLIKGNVATGTGEKIYYIPGWQGYEDIKIDLDYGEQWFCTEWQAYKAGFKAPAFTGRPETYPEVY